jgi:ABC-2 type transport system ATP-binding protein
MSGLRFNGVCKAFGDKRILNRLDREVGRAEVYGLLGHNGSGKSTAINILCNLLDPDSGTVELDGEPASRATRKAIGLCPQDIALYRDLYPAEDLRFFADIYGVPKVQAARRVAELMDTFGLERFARTRAAALSGGWQRRLNVAVALVHSPQVLVLDEPTAGVDTEARFELWKIIEALKRRGMTFLITTHRLDEAERLCSRIGIMKDGTIAREGTVLELLALVPAKAIALVDVANSDAALARASQLGWGVGQYAGKLAFRLPRQSRSKRSSVRSAALVRPLSPFKACRWSTPTSKSCTRTEDPIANPTWTTPKGE